MAEVEEPTSAPTGMGRRTSRGAVWVAAATWLQRGVAVVVLLALAGVLDPRALGTASLASLLSFLLLAVSELGFLNALIYQRTRVREAAETTLFVTGACTLVLAAGLFLLADPLARFFGTPEAGDVLRVYALVLPFSALAQVAEAELTRLLAFSRRFAASVPSVLGAVVTVVLAVRGAGVWSIVVGDAVREVLRCLVAFAVLPQRFGPRWHREVAREMWRYARGSFTATWLDNALQNVDYLLVGKLLGPGALGLYTLAFRVAILPFVVVTQVVVGVMFPALVQVSDDRRRMEDGFQVSFRLGAAAVVLLGGGVSALAPYLALLGEDWRAATTAAQLLGVYVCFRSAAFMATPVVQALGRPGAVAVLRGAWVVLLVLLLLTVGRRGITEVAAVQVLVAAVLFLAHAKLAADLGGASLPRLLLDLARPLLAALVAAGALLAVRRLGGTWDDDTSVVAFLVAGVLFTLVYLGALLALGPRLLRDVRRVVGTLRSR
ncbi:oligosaccharide flippase family protein [Kineococcus sp. SYSU DK006]|uniref:oligosaccharide flippase family protein n=1 Tax=Kineococcus sp. SYSU DK006 TaxID=3383127 RepID=UPI003D7CD416